MSSHPFGDAGHCPTCGGRVSVISTDEGTSHFQPMLDRATDVFVCPNGHVVPFLLVHECDCDATVLYVPHAVELALRREIAQLRARLEP